MAVLIPNDFSSYELTEQEEIEGAKLTITQKQLIQNYLSGAAIEKNGLEYDHNNSERFIQQEASLKGQMDAYRHLLDSSDAADELSIVPEPNLDTTP